MSIKKTETLDKHSQVTKACDVLEHYHIAHTTDVITRFRFPDNDGVDIYVTANPEWKRRLREATASEFEVQ